MLIASIKLNGLSSTIILLDQLGLRTNGSRRDFVVGYCRGCGHYRLWIDRPLVALAQSRDYPIGKNCKFDFFCVI